MSQEEKADALMIQGDKKVKSFWPGGSKYEEASEMYVKAANLYKVVKKWDEAGKAFLKSADCQIKAQTKHEAATNYAEAANCFKKVNTPEAVNCLKLAIEIYLDMGRFPMAAKYHKDIAELYETDNNLEDAIQHYTTAAEFYTGEEAASSANQCLLKVAQFAAAIKKYELAIEKFEVVANASINNPLLKWSVKEYLFKAGICNFVLDVDKTESALEKYKDIDVTFSSSRECILLENLIKYYKEGKVDKFTDELIAYDKLSPLDKWKVDMFTLIKASINSLT